MTPLAAILSRLGLSQSQAAAALGVRRDTVANWAVGRRKIPETTWRELAQLARQRAVDIRQLADEIESQAPAPSA